MLILDTFSALENGRISIPFYHRGHLSLMSGTKATIVYLPGQKKNPVPGISELIITPVDFRSWQYLTRINARLANKPGLFRKLLKALSMKDIDLLYHAVGPLENGTLLRVEFLVDAKSFYDEYKKYMTLKTDTRNADHHILSELEIWLKGLLIDHLDFDGKRARLKVRPMEAFRRAWESFREYRDDDDYQSPAKGKATIRRGTLELPRAIIEVIPMSTNKIMFISDTKDRMLRGMLFSPLDSCTYLRIEHNDEIDSSAVISDALSSSFLVISSLSRVRSQGDKSVIEYMLYSPEMPLLIHEESRRKLINAILSSSNLNDLDLLVSYPNSVGSIGPLPLEPTKTENDSALITHISDLVPLEKDLMTESSGRILKDRMDKHYANIASQGGLGNSLNSKMIHSACRELLLKIGHEKLEQSPVFVSYAFQFEDLFGILEKALLAMRYRIITGKDIESGDAYRKTIISRIKSCHGFIGIWKFDDKAGPIKFSPWLSWELGIAQSCEMPTRIFPHKNLSDPAFTPHRKILPEINMPAFSDSDFLSYIGLAEKAISIAPQLIPGTISR
jgi:hypothetical protein